MSNDVRENRLRRMAKRQGLELQKSRRRDPHAVDFGAYWLIDPRRRLYVVGDYERGTTLDAIEAYLTGEAR